MNTVTGDVEMHLARRLEALGPWVRASGSMRNTWTSAEPVPDGKVAVDAYVVELVAGRNPGSNTDSQREFDLQVMRRIDMHKKNAVPAAFKDMRAIADALHRSGEFVDTVETQARYVQAIVLDAPIYLERSYIIFNVTLMRDG